MGLTTPQCPAASALLAVNMEPLLIQLLQYHHFAWTGIIQGTLAPLATTLFLQRSQSGETQAVECMENPERRAQSDKKHQLAARGT